MSEANLNLSERWDTQLAKAGEGKGPDWLRSLKDSAAAQFRSAGLPDRKVEAWRYTPLKLLELIQPELLSESSAEAKVAEPTAALLDGVPSVDILDGRIASSLAAISPAKNGLDVLSFQQGLAKYEEILRPLLEGAQLAGRERALSALNTAQLDHGLLIYVPANVDAGDVLLRWAGSGGNSVFNQFRLLVILEPGATLGLIEQYQESNHNSQLLNVVVQIVVGDAAALKHVRLQHEGEESVLLTSTSVEQKEASRYELHGFDLGAALVRHEIEVDLVGEDAHVSLNGAFVLHDQRHADNHLSVHHEAQNCRSEQFYRGVLGGRSRGVFNGRALIREGADGSSIEQSNANLLLSRNAEIDTKPELEIYADEVEASHGATVGQLDESAIFYLRSRGLSDSQARRMLTAAFCRAVSDRIENRALAETIATHVDEVMAKLKENNE